MSIVDEGMPEETDTTIDQVMEIRDLIRDTAQKVGAGVRTGYSHTVPSTDPEVKVRVGAGKREVYRPGSLPEYITVPFGDDERTVRNRDRHLTASYKDDKSGHRLIVLQTDTALQMGQYRSDHNRYVFDVVNGRVISKCIGQTTVFAVFAEKHLRIDTPERDDTRRSESDKASVFSFSDTEAFNPLAEYGVHAVSQTEADELIDWISRYRLDLFEHIDSRRAVGLERLR